MRLPLLLSLLLACVLAYSAGTLENPSGSAKGGSGAVFNFSVSKRLAPFTAQQVGGKYVSIKPGAAGLISIFGRIYWTATCTAGGRAALALRNKATGLRVYSSGQATYSQNQLWYISASDQATATTEYDVYAWYGNANCTITITSGHILFEQPIQG